jgi:hypothetical protein
MKRTGRAMRHALLAEVELALADRDRTATAG